MHIIIIIIVVIHVNPLLSPCESEMPQILRKIQYSKQGRSVQLHISMVEDRKHTNVATQYPLG